LRKGVPKKKKKKGHTTLNGSLEKKTWIKENDATADRVAQAPTNHRAASVTVREGGRRDGRRPGREKEIKKKERVSSESDVGKKNQRGTPRSLLRSK